MIDPPSRMNRSCFLQNDSSYVAFSPLGGRRGPEGE